MLQLFAIINSELIWTSDEKGMIKHHVIEFPR